MSNVSSKLKKLLEIKEEQRKLLGISEEEPFHNYINYMRKKIPNKPLYADFVANEYWMNGKEVGFEDAFEFIRMSKATMEVDGDIKIYQEDEPRLSGKGLLIEPESTNYLTNNMNLKEGAWSTGDNLASIVRVGDATFKVMPDGRLVHHAAVPEVNGKVATSSCYILDRQSELVMSSRRVSDGTYTSGIRVGEEIEKLGSSTREVFREGSQFGFSRAAGTGAGYSSWQIEQAEGEYVVSCPQWEEGERMTSGILTGSVPVTRVPDSLKVKVDGEITLDADDGIIETDGKITGFGFIRKLEVE